MAVYRFILTGCTHDKVAAVQQALAGLSGLQCTLLQTDGFGYVVEVVAPDSMSEDDVLAILTSALAGLGISVTAAFAEVERKPPQTKRFVIAVSPGKVGLTMANITKRLHAALGTDFDLIAIGEAEHQMRMHEEFLLEVTNGLTFDDCWNLIEVIVKDFPDAALTDIEALKPVAPVKLNKATTKATTKKYKS